MKYEARIELYDKSSVSHKNSKMKLETEKPILNLTNFLANVPSYFHHSVSCSSRSIPIIFL